MFEQLGGGFIKLGQMLALQPDVIPFEYCTALYDLMDRVAPIPFVEIEKVIVQEVGVDYGRVFTNIDRVPLATASLAQVHTAETAGRKVVIKVQRPGVRDVFASDIAMMRAALWFIRTFRVGSLHFLVDPMREFIDWTNEELDFRNEARYMKRLSQTAHRNQFERVPDVVEELTTERLLTAEFLDGVPVLNLLRSTGAPNDVLDRRLRSLGFEPDRFASNVIRNFLNDAFRHGMFHADLHPANLLIMPGNAVGYVDFGITGVLSAYSRLHLIQLTLAYSRRDTDAMCDSFFRISTTGPHADMGAFRRRLWELSRDWYGIFPDQPRFRKTITLVMFELLTLSRSAGILPHRDVIRYIRSAIAIDGLIRRFAPHFDVGRELETVCREQLSAGSLSATFSYGSGLDFADAVVRLLRDGPTRLTQALALVSEISDERAGYASTGASWRTRDPNRPVRLAVLVLALVGVLCLPDIHQAPGLNIFTVAAGLSLAALGATLRELLWLE